MGGRGAVSGITSGGVKALIVKFQNGISKEYREKNGVLLERSVGGTFQPTNATRTLNDLVSTAKKNGYEYTTLNAAQVRKYDSEYKKNRAMSSKQLDDLWFRAAPKKKKGMKGH